MTTANTYSTKELEARIDNCRLENDWKGACDLVERYARIFDVGAASTAVSTDKSRSFYWTVMAEVVMYHNANFEKASYCLCKAAAYSPDAIQWRIILVKVLLARFQDVISLTCRMRNTGMKAGTPTDGPPQTLHIDDSSYVNALQVIICNSTMLIIY